MDNFLKGLACGAVYAVAFAITYRAVNAGVELTSGE